MESLPLKCDGFAHTRLEPLDDRQNNIKIGAWDGLKQDPENVVAATGHDIGVADTQS